MEYKSDVTGARIVINPCSFMEAFKLKSVLQRALISTGINIEEAFDEDLIKFIFSLDSSEEVMLCLFECLKRSQYNDVAIKPDVFDDLKAREDLYDIFFNCIKINLGPFLQSLLSKLGINVPADQLKGLLKQKLKTTSNSSAALSQGTGISEATPTE